MERLQLIKEDHERNLEALKSGGPNSLDRIVGLETFADFSACYSKLILKDTDVSQKKQIIQKCVKKVEVSPNSFKIHFIVDQDHYKREITL